MTCVYVNPETDQSWIIDYRIYNPAGDGKTKLDHVAEMMQGARNPIAAWTACPGPPPSSNAARSSQNQGLSSPAQGESLPSSAAYPARGRGGRPRCVRLPVESRAISPRNQAIDRAGSCQCGDGSRPDPASARSSGVCHPPGAGRGPTRNLLSLVIFPTKRFGNAVPGMLTRIVLAKSSSINQEGKMILVVGATGLVGSEICGQLAARGKQVRALVRATADPAKVDRLRALGAEITVGDLRDANSLQAACRGANAVITTASALPFTYEPDVNTPQTTDQDGYLSLIAAAREAGTRHFVHTSFPPVAASFPLQDAKRAVEDGLRSSGLTYTILQPTFFSEVWLSPGMGFDYVNHKATIYGEGQNATSWISYADVAQFAVACLDNPAARNATLELGGPDALSPLAVVGVFEKVGGRSFRGHACSHRSAAKPACGSDRPHAEVLQRADARLCRRQGNRHARDAQGVPHPADFGRGVCRGACVPYSGEAKWRDEAMKSLGLAVLVHSSVMLSRRRVRPGRDAALPPPHLRPHRVPPTLAPPTAVPPTPAPPTAVPAHPRGGPGRPGEGLRGRAERR